MRGALQLSISVGAAAFMAFVGSIALVLAAIGLGLNLDKSSAGATAGIAILVFVPSVAAAVWLFRRLQPAYHRREARAISITFGVVTPISLSVSMVLGEISGGYAESMFRRPVFGAVGAFTGALVMTALLSLAVCAFVLRVTRLTIDVEKSDSSTSPD